MRLPWVLSPELSEPSGRAVTVNYRTANNTALAGGDLQSVLGAIVFEPSATHKQVFVSVVGDARQQGDETFFLDIVSADHAHVARGTGTLLAEDYQLPGHGPTAIAS